MSFKIAVCSGKGGTGKTTIAVSLFETIRTKWTNKIQLIDCDVEEPNDLLFFNKSQLVHRSVIHQSVPKINIDHCSFCKRCDDFCEFNAITIIPKTKHAFIDADMCHSCGACLHACKYSAISETLHSIGDNALYKTDNGAEILEGNLKIGSPMQTRVIQELKKQVNTESQIQIYDAPPGTSCPVVETVADADFVLLVTEPTPFGMYDLKLSIDLMREMNKPFGLIVNKAGIGDQEIYELIKNESLDLLAEIPFNKDYASQYSKGELLSDIPEVIEQEYLKLAVYLKNKMKYA